MRSLVIEISQQCNLATTKMNFTVAAMTFAFREKISLIITDGCEGNDASRSNIKLSF